VPRDEARRYPGGAGLEADNMLATQSMVMAGMDAASALRLARAGG
jgi:hypothetical protein